MNIFESLFLGVVQGVTEFIPVSSSGHLVIFQNLFGLRPDHMFIEFINFGTLLALLYFFRDKIRTITKDIFSKKDYKLALNILITALPAGITGYLLADFIESNSFFVNINVVLTALGLVGILMVIIEKITKYNKTSELEQITKRHALAIGIIQVFSLIPGVSRSGSTIIAGRLLGFNSILSAEYSFLASIPIMIGVSLKLLIKDNDYLLNNLSIVIVSNIFAFLAGLVAIKFLLAILSKRGLAVFGWYRIILVCIIILGLNIK